MGRIFWLVLGAILGSTVTRKVMKLRETLTLEVIVESAITGAAVLISKLLNSLRSIVMNSFRTPPAEQIAPQPAEKP